MYLPMRLCSILVFCNKYVGIFYDQSSFIATDVPMYVINVNGTKTFIWKFINLVVPGRIWVKYSKLFYRVKAVDCNLLSAFRSFEMCNGAKALIKSQMYFLFQSIFREYRAQTLPSCLIECLFRTRKGNVILSYFFQRENLHFSNSNMKWDYWDFNNFLQFASYLY